AQLVPERVKTIVEGVFLADFDRGLGQARLGYGVAHAQRGARRKAKRRGQLPAHRAQGAGGESAIARDPERGAVPLAARDLRRIERPQRLDRVSIHRGVEVQIDARLVKEFVKQQDRVAAILLLDRPGTTGGGEEAASAELVTQRDVAERADD